MDLSRLTRFTAIVAAAALLAGCGGDGGTDPNAPPTTSILSPDDGATFTAGESITFQATASDPEDGSLTGSRVVWSSSLDGQLGTGTSLVASLTAGNHTVTVTATDSDGEQATASISVEVAQLASVCSPGDPGVDMNLAVGEHATFSGEAAYCLQFGQTSSTAEYLLGVQSTASTVSSLTPIRVTGDAGEAAAMIPGGLRADAPLVRSEEPTAVDPGLLLSDRAQRLRQHRAAESRLREWERENLPLLRSAAAGEEMGSASSLALAIPPVVDDTVDLRVADLTRQINLCTGYSEVRGVVRLVGENSIWLEDVENPEPGLSLADLQELSDLFDQTIHQVDSTWFGAPTDIDQNGRMAVLITKEVNRADEPISPDTSQVSSTLGFVFSGDLL
ncbi:MAG: Ig-like domain-containing protein, partial [Longimicrobiales bacterium]|nr:Ig-like domain-containing protein [Longimicrobiales bacterium]